MLWMISGASTEAVWVLLPFFAYQSLIVTSVNTNTPLFGGIRKGIKNEKILQTGFLHYYYRKK